MLAKPVLRLLPAVLLALLFAPAAQAQTPVWSRASRLGSFGPDAGDAVAVDAAGNTYVAGRFGSAGLTVGTTVLNNAANTGTTDVLVAKYSPAGVVLWATRLGGSGDDAPAALAVDAAGNAYVAGNFEGTLPVGGNTLASAGTVDMFLVCLSPAGVPQWGVRAGGTANDVGTAVALDDAGFVWFGGSFQGTATVSGTANTLVSAGGFDAALIKVGAGSGTFVRMGREGGTGGDYLEGLATAGSDVYATGWFSGATLPVAGGPTFTRRCANRDGFLIKYDRFRVLLWARAEGAAGATRYANYAVATDPNGTVVTGGEFEGTVVPGGFDTLNNPSATPAPMVVRYDAAGNVTSGRGGGGLSNGRVTGLARDAAGSTYACGYFRGTTTWGFASATSAGNNDVFVVKLPATGSAAWVVRAGGPDNDLAYGLALDAAGLLYLAGAVSGSAPFGTLPALVSAGQTDAFVARLGGTITATRTARTVQPLAAWPNPVAADRALHLALPAAAGPATLRLYDVAGRLAHTQPVPAAAALTLPAALAPGRYLAEVQAAGQTLRCALRVE